MAYVASGGKRALAQSVFQLGGNAGSALGPLLAAERARQAVAEIVGVEPVPGQRTQPFSLSMRLCLPPHEARVVGERVGHTVFLLEGQQGRERVPTRRLIRAGGVACAIVSGIQHDLPVAQRGQALRQALHHIIDRLHPGLSECGAHQCEQRAQSADALAGLMHARRGCRRVAAGVTAR